MCCFRKNRQVYDCSVIIGKIRISLVILRGLNALIRCTKRCLIVQCKRLYHLIKPDLDVISMHIYCRILTENMVVLEEKDPRVESIL